MWLATRRSSQVGGTTALDMSQHADPYIRSRHPLLDGLGQAIGTAVFIALGDDDQVDQFLRFSFSVNEVIKLSRSVLVSGMMMFSAPVAIPLCKAM